jgi:hypothetical protein
MGLKGHERQHGQDQTAQRELGTQDSNGASDLICLSKNEEVLGGKTEMSFSRRGGTVLPIAICGSWFLVFGQTLCI